MSNPVFVTPDGIRWEDCISYVIAVEDSTCETIGEFWPEQGIGEWFVPWFRMTYTHCDTTWYDEWDSAVDNECPVCGADITASEIEDLS